MDKKGGQYFRPTKTNKTSTGSDKMSVEVFSCSKTAVACFCVFVGLRCFYDKSRSLFTLSRSVFCRKLVFVKHSNK